MTVTQPASEASAPPPTRRPGGLHPTGLVVAVVGLLLSATAFFVTERDTREREDAELQDVADQVADQVSEALADVDALVSGIEGTIIATERAKEEDLHRLISLQVGRSDLITSASLLQANEGRSLQYFAGAGESRYIDIDELAATDPELLEERTALLAAIPEDGARMMTREPLRDRPSAALGVAFATHPDDPEAASGSWVVEVELTFPPEVIAAMAGGVTGAPRLAVFVGPDEGPENMLIGPASGEFMSSAQRNIQLGGGTAVVEIEPRTDLLSRNEQIVPLLVFLGGLTLTTVLTPLVGRLASRREEVRVLSAQRDELDRALNVSLQIERELRASEQRFRSVLQSSPDVVLWIDPEADTVQILNRDDLFGSAPTEAATTDQLLELAHPDDADLMREGLDHLYASESGTITEFECRLRRVDESFEWLRIRGGRVQRDDATSGPILAVLTTITDQKREEARRAQLEAQLVQSQRLEAVGQLAGGVAHDFNNILAAIVSGAELVLDEVDGETKEDVEEIRRTARRGSDLARQLLLFSRRDRGSAPEVVDVNEVITDVETMLRRTLDESIHLRTELTTEPHKVHIDPSQIERILMNLTINARDAMPHGGAITIATRNVEADDEFVSTRPDVRTGPYLELTVTDTGTGMPEDVRRHAFEPFFSTKEVGKGTGLGLATVYGIVQGAQGHIEIESSAGEGTTFSLLFPRTRLGQEERSIDAPESAASGGNERILLVEDEPAVREAARRLLEKRGYRVSVASDGSTAVMLASSGAFDLLLTDVLMPGGMNGREVARQVFKAQPQIAVLYMTGHSDDVLDDVGIDDDEREALIVRKPFTEDELLRAIHVAIAPVPEPTA